MLKDFNNCVEKIRNLLSEERKMLQKSNLTEVSEQDKEEIDGIVEKTTDTKFTVLVMGKFSSGKSALINVLLGEKILPEKSLPTTAIITEICYGEEKKAVIYPKKGSEHDSLESFEISTDEIATYCTIDNKLGFNVKDGDNVSSRFDKLVLYWPLDLLKENVVIVDSPGTDDPYESERIVEAYLPNADAVIYCVHSRLGYSDKDKNTLDKICIKGFNPIIVTTWIDLIPASERPAYIEGVKIDYNRHAADEYCHYVNSLLGLRAKKNNKGNELESSGYAQLEKFLGKFFAESKGKEKMSTLVSAVKNYNDNQVEFINNLLSVFDSEQSVFDAQVKSSLEALKKAKEKAELIKLDFRVNIGKICDDVIEKKIPDLHDNIASKINLDGFSSNVSFKDNTMSDGCKLIAEACSKEISRRNAVIADEWNKKVLFPYLSDSLNYLGSMIDKELKSFNDYIDKARVRLTADDKDSPKKITRLESFTLNLLKGDLFGSAIGEAQSDRTVGRALLLHGLGVLLLAAFDITTDAALVIVVLGSILIGKGWTELVAEKKIMAETKKQMDKYLEANKKTIISSASVKCKQKFDKIIEDFNAAIDADIKEAERKIENIKRERDAFAAESEKRKAELCAVIDNLNAANNKAAEIGKKYIV